MLPLALLALGFRPAPSRGLASELPGLRPLCVAPSPPAPPPRPPSLPRLLEARLRADSMHEELKERGEVEAGDYAELIRCYSDAGAADECRLLLRQMRRAGISPSLESYALVVSALSSSGQQQEAERWMERVVKPELAQAMISRTRESGSQVELLTYNKALSAWAAAGRPTEARDMLKQMVKEGLRPDIVSFNCIIAAHSAARSPFKALSWLERAIAWGVKADVVSFTSVIVGFARTSQPKEAERVMVRRANDYSGRRVDTLCWRVRR